MANVNHNYLRPIKARHRDGMLSSPFPMRQDLAVWQGTNATVYPLQEFPEDALLFGRGGVLDAEGNFVALSGIQNRIWGSYPCDAPEYHDKKVVYCGYLVPQWGHFLVEGITRLWYFLKNDPSIDKYVFFIEQDCDREIQGNYREFLELFGIWDHLEIISKPTTYREVLVPEMCYLVQHYHSENYRDIFEHIASNVMAMPYDAPLPEKIYFSRSQFRKQGNELNEFGHDLIDNFFEKNGFTIFSPEKTSLTDLIRCIRSAKVIASPSGSVAHNMLFAQQEKHVIVVERWVFNDDNQTDIDRIRNLNATYIDTDIPVYTTDIGGGPYILGYSQQLAQFTQDNGLLPPDDRYLTESYLRKCFASYMQAYWNTYRHRWYMEDWYTTCTDFLWEGYQAGYACFSDYLDGRKPYFWYHCFYPHYIKQAIKAILRKMGLYHG